MGVRLGKITIGSLFKKPETVQYPSESRFAPEGLKGHVSIAVADCIFCGICVKKCPADAITVTKDSSSWVIDVFRCVQCGSCVRECPKGCLRMEPSYSAPSTTKSLSKPIIA